MILASLGWGTWWVAALWAKVAPGTGPGIDTTGWIAGVFAVGGLMLALLTLRGSRGWLFLSFVAMFANGSLLVLPWLVRELVAKG